MLYAYDTYDVAVVVLYGTHAKLYVEDFVDILETVGAYLHNKRIVFLTKERGHPVIDFLKLILGVEQRELETAVFPSCLSFLVHPRIFPRSRIVYPHLYGIGMQYKVELAYYVSQHTLRLSLTQIERYARHYDDEYQEYDGVNCHTPFERHLFLYLLWI